MKMENLIVVTGYGQFAGHEINASGEAVKLLPKEIIVESKTFQIKTFEVSVEYAEVDEKIEEIWKMKPHLVIHCGKLCLTFITMIYKLSFFRRSRSS